MSRVHYLVHALTLIGKHAYYPSSRFAQGWKDIVELSLARIRINALAWFISCRPRQWTKNLIIYFAFFFSAGQAWNVDDIEGLWEAFAVASSAFGIFCLASSAIYIFNDACDIEKDVRHPAKRYRPIPAGTISAKTAIVISILMSLIAATLSTQLGSDYSLILITYIVAMFAYTIYLKHLVILDVMVISFGFVLRAVAGAIVLGVYISPWLYICTTLGALFLGFAKRLNESILANGEGAMQRDTLESYSPAFLEALIPVVASATIVSYILYTFSAVNLPDNNSMMFTIPFVIYGVFRYLYLIHEKKLGESPENILLNDKPIIVTIGLWLITVLTILLLYR